MGLSLRTIRRIWVAHKVQPHRIKTLKRSNDPHFAAKLDDVVGLYMNPPRRAEVVSIDEKSQIQALDRTQLGLPLKRGKCATLRQDYKRHGTTTLFAALSVLEGKVIGRCVPPPLTSRVHPLYRNRRAVRAGRQADPPSSTIMPPTNILGCWPGSPSIRDGRSTSRRPPAPGSMPWKASSPSSLGRASNGASFARLTTSTRDRVAGACLPRGSSCSLGGTPCCAQFGQHQCSNGRCVPPPPTCNGVRRPTEACGLGWQCCGTDGWVCGGCH